MRVSETEERARADGTREELDVVERQFEAELVRLFDEEREQVDKERKKLHEQLSSIR